MFWPQVAGTSYDMRPDQFRYVDKRIQELGEVVRRKVFDWEENESGLGEVKVRIYFMQTPAGEVVYALSIDSWTPREKNNGFVRCYFDVFPTSQSDSIGASRSLDDILKDAHKLPLRRAGQEEAVKEI